MLLVLLVATVTGLCTSLGALPFLVVRRVPRRAFDALLGLGAGLMLSAATIGLLGHALGSLRGSEGLHLSRLLVVVAGFSAGFVILAVVERLIPHEHAGGHHEHLRHGGRRPGDEDDPLVGAPPEPPAARLAVPGGAPALASLPATAAPAPADERLVHQRLGVAITGALVFHRLPEGFAIGASFATGETAPLGGLVAIAVALQNIIEGMVSTAPLRQGGVSRLKAVGATVVTGLTVPVAAALGYAFSRFAHGTLPFALALGAGSLIAVTSNEIIPETHSHGNEAVATIGVIAGFVFTIVLRAALGVE